MPVSEAEANGLHVELRRRACDHEAVVAAAPVERVVAAVGGQRVVARTAEQRVGVGCGAPAVIAARVLARLVVQEVVAVAAGEHVVAQAPGQYVRRGIALGVDVAERAREAHVLHIGIVAQAHDRAGCRGDDDGVGAFACLFDDGVARTDHVGVVPQAANQAVRGAVPRAVEPVVAGHSRRADRSAADQRDVLDVRILAQRRLEGRLDGVVRTVGAALVDAVLDDDVGQAVDDVRVVARAADQGIRAGPAVEAERCGAGEREVAVRVPPLRVQLVLVEGGIDRVGQGVADQLVRKVVRAAAIEAKVDIADRVGRDEHEVLDVGRQLRRPEARPIRVDAFARLLDDRDAAEAGRVHGRGHAVVGDPGEIDVVALAAVERCAIEAGIRLEQVVAGVAVDGGGCRGWNREQVERPGQREAREIRRRHPVAHRRRRLVARGVGSVVDDVVPVVDDEVVRLVGGVHRVDRSPRTCEPGIDGGEIPARAVAEADGLDVAQRSRGEVVRDPQLVGAAVQLDHQ